MVVLTVLLLGRLPADSPPDPAALPPPPEPLRSGFRAIEEADLEAWVHFLASEELEGRETGRRGYDVAARFCATFFARYGLKPAGDGGGYFQDFEVVRTEPDLEGSWLELEDASGTERFPLEGNLALGGPPSLEWSGRWTFVGHGEGAESDAPDSFRGLPLEERVVLVLPREGQTRHEARGALRAGARRVAVISDEKVKSRAGLRSQERPPFLRPAEPPRLPEVLYLSRRVADRLLKGRGLTVEELLRRKEPLPRLELEDVQIRVSVKQKVLKLTGRNVVGLLEGADPALRAEAVAVGAHLDHMGAHDGKVFRGADDNASGSAGVLALVKAFAESPRRPARSVLFLLFGGEEKGLWGSRWFVDNPPLPLERITAQIQMDMIGRNEERPSKKEPAEENTNTVHLVGSERLSRDVHRTVLSMNRFVGLEFEYDEEEVYSRSDQYSFGERGIPVAFFFTGFHPDYHQPTDTPEKINYPKLARIVRLVFATAFDLADRPRPLARIGRL